MSTTMTREWNIGDKLERLVPGRGEPMPGVVVSKADASGLIVVRLGSEASEQKVHKLHGSSPTLRRLD